MRVERFSSPRGPRGENPAQIRSSRAQASAYMVSTSKPRSDQRTRRTMIEVAGLRSRYRCREGATAWTVRARRSRSSSTAVAVGTAEAASGGGHSTTSIRYFIASRYARSSHDVPSRWLSRYGAVVIGFRLPLRSPSVPTSIIDIEG